MCKFGGHAEEHTHVILENMLDGSMALVLHIFHIFRN